MAPEHFTEVEHLRNDNAQLTRALATFARTGCYAKQGLFRDRNPEFTVMSCLNALFAVRDHSFVPPPADDAHDDDWLAWHGKLDRFLAGDLGLSEVGYRHEQLIAPVAMPELLPLHYHILAALADGTAQSFDLLRKSLAGSRESSGYSDSAMRSALDFLIAWKLVSLVGIGSYRITDKGKEVSDARTYATAYSRPDVPPKLPEPRQDSLAGLTDGSWGMIEALGSSTSRLRAAITWPELVERIAFVTGVKYDEGVLEACLNELRSRNLVRAAVGESVRYCLTPEGVQAYDSRYGNKPERPATLSDFDRTVLKVLAESTLPALTAGAIFQRLHILTGSVPRNSAISAALVVLMQNDLVQESKGVPHATAYTATTNGRQFHRDYPFVVVREVGPHAGKADLHKWMPEDGDAVRRAEAVDSVVPYKPNMRDSAVGEFMIHHPSLTVLGDLEQRVLMLVRGQAMSRMTIYYKVNEAGETNMPARLDEALRTLHDLNFVHHFREMFWGTPTGRAWLGQYHPKGRDPWFREPDPALTWNEELALSIFDDCYERLRRVDQAMLERGLVGLRVDMADMDSARRHYLQSRENLVY